MCLCHSLWFGFSKCTAAQLVEFKSKSWFIYFYLLLLWTKTNWISCFPLTNAFKVSTHSSEDFRSLAWFLLFRHTDTIATQSPTPSPDVQFQGPQRPLHVTSTCRDVNIEDCIRSERLFRFSRFPGNGKEDIHRISSEQIHPWCLNIEDCDWFAQNVVLGSVAFLGNSRFWRSSKSACDFRK